VSRILSELLREQLRDAKTEGQLIELPKEDWAAGFRGLADRCSRQAGPTHEIAAAQAFLRFGWAGTGILASGGSRTFLAR
jgi:hypothetical protein